MVMFVVEVDTELDVELDDDVPPFAVPPAICD
jgi:hypothetical protein